AYMFAREDGQTYVGASVEEVGFRKQNTASVLARLRAAAARLVPGLQGVPQRRAWAGLRPASADGLPVMGRLPGWPNVGVSSGHFRNGILMAPASARLVSQAILSGKASTELQPFSPARFVH